MTDQYVLFIHISRTGGSSVAKAPFITKHGSPFVNPKITMQDPSLKFSFTFVRDPYSRFTSALFSQGYCLPENFEEWVLTEFMPEYKERFEKLEWQDLMPQHKYVYFDGEISVDYIGKIETIDKDWERICAKAQTRFDLPHTNMGRFTSHQFCHTERTKAAVREAYAKDFELFGYEQ